MAGPVSLVFVSSLPRWGGGEQWMLAAARAMAERGHRVCLVGQPGGELARRAAACGLRARPLRMGGILVPWTIAALRRIFAAERATTAIVNLERETRLTALAARGRRGFHLVARRGSPVPLKDNWHYRLVYRRWVDRLIVNSRAVGESVLSRAPWFDRGRLRIIPNGIDVDAYAASARRGRARAELGIAPERPVVACVGEVGRRKGQAVLLEAVARLRAAGCSPDALFLIAGEGEGLATLPARARELGLGEDAVRWLGFRADVPDLLADSDLLVLPSFEEGFPNALLEGMALGLPVVSTRVDGIPELVRHGETGLLVDAGDAPALAQAIGALLSDPERRRALGEAGRARARAEFSQSRAMAALEACLCDWS